MLSLAHVFLILEQPVKTDKYGNNALVESNELIKYNACWAGYKIFKRWHLYLVFSAVKGIPV